MPDQFEQSLREVLSQRAGQFDPGSIARLRAIDYHPRQRERRTLPALGALGVAGTAAAITAIVSLGSSAAPAFAGWRSKPTAPAPGQLAEAAQACGQSLGSPVLTDSRGPYTTAIYADSTSSALCLQGNDVSMSSESTSSVPVTVAAGRIQTGGGVMRDAAGSMLTVADGRAGAGVTAVAIELSDGSSVQATVEGGWYLAWWPGNVTAKSAEITTASGISTVGFQTPSLPPCPAGAQCSAGGSSSGSTGGPVVGGSTTTISGGSASSSQ